MSLTFLPYVLYALEIVAKTLVIAVVLGRRRGTAQTRLTWIVVILAVPIAGIALYLLVGGISIGGRRVRRHRRIVERIQSVHLLAEAHPEVMRLELDDQPSRMAALAESVARCPPRAGNRLTLLAETGGFVDALVADIDAAESHCHLLFYIYLADASGRRVAEALERAAARGVTCRLLVDAVGSKRFLRSPLRRSLERAGVRVVEALPANAVRMLFARIDLRNHRKIAVVDGVIGYVGSHNVADAAFAPKPRYAPWVDTTVRIDGPVVRDLQVLFVEDWFLDTDEALEDLLAVHPAPHADGVPAQLMGTGPGFRNEALRLLIQMATHAAREELILTTPYFVPDDGTLAALRSAAHRGVATTLVVPARNDSPIVGLASRGQYEALLEAGVRVHEFTDGLLHAKTMTLDRSIAMVGSANLDRRSFDLNFEVSMVVYDSDFASHLRFLQRSYVDRSTPVDAAAWRRRAPARRVIENAAGTLSPLL